MITHDPSNFGRAIEYTEAINIIPNEWGVVQRIKLFRHEYKTQKAILIPRTTEEAHILVDRNWNERNPSLAGGKVEYIPFNIPHYPKDDAILPSDIDGMLDIQNWLAGGLQLETVERVRARKMMRIRKAHATTLEFARMQVLKDGSVYAPNQTVSINYYDAYGITRKVIDLDLDSNIVDPKRGIEEAIGYLQDSLQTGENVTNFVALCSPTFFSGLTNNPSVREQYLYLQRPQGEAFSVGRLTAGSPFDARFRTFDYGGVLWVEVRGGVVDQPYVEDGEAYMFPVGTDNFVTYFAPADRLSTVNEVAQESYYFEYPDPKNDIIEIMSETNFLNVLRRPDQVITLKSGS